MKTSHPRASRLLAYAIFPHQATSLGRSLSWRRWLCSPHREDSLDCGAGDDDTAFFDVNDETNFVDNSCEDLQPIDGSEGGPMAQVKRRTWWRFLNVRAGVSIPAISAPPRARSGTIAKGNGLPFVALGGSQNPNRRGCRITRASGPAVPAPPQPEAPESV